MPERWCHKPTGRHPGDTDLSSKGHTYSLLELLGGSCTQPRSCLVSPNCWGAVVGQVAVHFHPMLNPLFMAFVAKAMVFVSVHELLPMAKRYHRLRLFALGAVISVLIYALVPA